MFNKIIQLLENHGVYYTIENNNIYCFYCANNDEKDIIAIINDKVYINGEPSNILHFLGY